MIYCHPFEIGKLMDKPLRWCVFLLTLFLFSGQEVCAGFSTSGGPFSAAPVDMPPAAASTPRPQPTHKATKAPAPDVKEDTSPQQSDKNPQQSGENEPSRASSPSPRAETPEPDFPPKTPEEHWDDFFTLFDPSCPHISPFPMNFTEEDIMFQKGKAGSVKIFVSGEGGCVEENFLEEFTVPKDLDTGPLRPYFMSLRQAAVSKHDDALRIHALFWALLKDLGRENLLQELESVPLSPEALIAQFPAWVESLRTTYIDPFNTDPLAFIREHTESLEWVETTFRGWFGLEAGTEVTEAQAATLLESAGNLGEFLSAFTVTLFELFEDDKIGAWEEEFFQSVQETVGEDAEDSESMAASGLDFTPEEQRVPVRRRLFTIHQMIVQGYYTVADLLKSLTIKTPPNTGGWDAQVYQGHKEASDLQMKLLFFRTLAPFSKAPHFNMHLVKSQVGVEAFTSSYEEFMTSTLETRSAQGLDVLRHKLLHTKEELNFTRDNLAHRLTAKGKILKGEALPLFEVNSMWFQTLKNAYNIRLEQFEIPDNLQPKDLEELRAQQKALQEKYCEIMKKAQKWGQTFEFLKQRLDAIEAQRLELGLESLPDLEDEEPIL